MFPFHLFTHFSEDADSHFRINSQFIQQIYCPLHVVMSTCKADTPEGLVRTGVGVPKTIPQYLEVTLFGVGVAYMAGTGSGRGVVGEIHLLKSGV